MIRRVVERITQVRAEYASARLICENLEHRVSGTVRPARVASLSAEVDYRTGDEQSLTVRVRDYDVRFLDRVASDEAVEHVNLIHQARHGNALAREELKARTRRLHPRMAERFRGGELVENRHVIPYTAGGEFPEEEISNKGAILLDLSRRGFATSEFILLAGSTFPLAPAERGRHALDAIHDLERLSGRRLGDPDNPLLVAMRTAMPEYLPGYMPTYLNVGYTEGLHPGLAVRYGEDAAARIRLNNRKTLLEALDPAAFVGLEPSLRPGLSRAGNDRLSEAIETLVREKDERLLTNPREQVLFFLEKAYDYYRDHLDTLRNFLRQGSRHPAVIFQRMVCSVLDDHSYAGVLYSRHPRTGTGVHLQYARTIFGEDLMTGRVVPEQASFAHAAAARREFPAVYHFWPRLAELEGIFGAPVMVEFTGVHGTFTLLQVNQAELSGIGMLTAVMDLHRAGSISAERVRELIRPYHVRQIESDAIDPRSIRSLTTFCRGFSVLPGSSVTGRICFSSDRAQRGEERWPGEKVILARPRFTPRDAISMQSVHGILSLSPAAIHVVTTAQNLGIPALLDLEEEQVRIQEGAEPCMTNPSGQAVREGDWVTISSRHRTLYLGRAAFEPARLLRYMAGEDLGIAPEEEERFRRWAAYYREYRLILENVTAAEFESLEDLGHAIRYGELRGEDARAAEFVNRSFDAGEDRVVRRLLDTTLGSHLVNLTAFRLLTPDRQVRLMKAALAACRARGLSGYQAGAFVIGGLLRPASSTSFWPSFPPDAIAELVNEWVLHQKYVAILSDVGERHVRRAEDRILSGGMERILLDEGGVRELLPLKLSGVDLNRVRAALPEGCDPQTAEVLDLLRGVRVGRRARRRS